MDISLMRRYMGMINGLGSYVDKQTKTVELIGKGEVKEIAIRTPFLLRDETNLELRLRKEGEDIFLHDNSWLYMYLDDYGIAIDSTSLRQKRYGDFISTLMKRNDFGYDQNWRWFYKMCTPKTTEDDLWKFIHSLQMISDLALVKTLRPLALPVLQR